jgi:hypothetical protein
VSLRVDEAFPVGDRGQRRQARIRVFSRVNHGQELGRRAHGLLKAPAAWFRGARSGSSRGRDHCGNRLSYSNIGDEQPTI